MDQLHEVAMQAICAAVPAPDERLKVSVIRNGHVVTVEGDVDGLIDIILAAVLPVHRVMVLSEVAAELERLPRIGGTNAR